jgi:hypothetical protein
LRIFFLKFQRRAGRPTANAKHQQLLRTSPAVLSMWPYKNKYFSHPSLVIFLSFFLPTPPTKPNQIGIANRRETTTTPIFQVIWREYNSLELEGSSRGLPWSLFFSSKSLVTLERTQVSFILSQA